MSGVYYVDLKARDVFRWYREESHGCGRESPTLLAADGIHPNSKCYEKWAKFVGNTFIDRHVFAKVETPSFDLKDHSSFVNKQLQDVPEPLQI
jgi:hypothetical protein